MRRTEPPRRSTPSCRVAGRHSPRKFARSAKAKLLSQSAVVRKIAADFRGVFVGVIRTTCSYDLSPKISVRFGIARREYSKTLGAVTRSVTVPRWILRNNRPPRWLFVKNISRRGQSIPRCRNSVKRFGALRVSIMRANRRKRRARGVKPHVPNARRTSCTIERPTCPAVRARLNRSTSQAAGNRRGRRTL